MKLEQLPGPLPRIWHYTVMNAAGTCEAAEGFRPTLAAANAEAIRYIRWRAEMDMETARLETLAHFTALALAPLNSNQRPQPPTGERPCPNLP